MADARIKGEWLNSMRFDSLTDTTWRVFTGALMWSAENGTDGFIPTRYLRMLHPDGEQPAAFTQMEAAGLCQKTPTGYQFDDWDGGLGQSTSAQIEAYKANARKRARDYRERERKKLVKSVGIEDPPVTSDVTRDVREHVGEGKGKGKGGGYEQVSTDKTINANEATGELVDIPPPVISWPVAEIPNDPGYCQHGMTHGKRCRDCERERKAS